MTDDRKTGSDEEPQRVLGVPTDLFRPRDRDAEEPQRVLGVPVDFFRAGPGSGEGRQALAHPGRTYRQWAQRRRAGASGTAAEPPGKAADEPAAEQGER